MFFFYFSEGFSVYLLKEICLIFSEKANEITMFKGWTAKILTLQSLNSKSEFQLPI